MKIVRKDKHRLELRGIPGGATAVYVPLGAGLIWSVVCGVFAFSLYQKDTSPWLIALLTLIGLIGPAMILYGIRNAFLREELVFDLDRREGSHRVRSPLGTSREIGFAFTDIDSVALEYRIERHRGGNEERIVENEVWEVKLRIRHPRRTILLARSQSGNETQVRTLAEEVCRGVGLPLVDESGDRPERVSAAEVGKTLAEKADWEVFRIPEPPRGSRIRIHLDRDRGRMILEWRLLTGVHAALMAIPLGGIWAGFFVIPALGLLGAAGLLPIELTNQGIERALTVGLMIAFLLGSFWLARLVLIALWGRVRVIVTRASLIREIDYPIQSVLRLWPFLPARLRTQQIPLTDIQTVRTNTKQERIEIHGRGKILRLHMQGAKTDELKWAAKLVRSALKLLVVGIPLRQGAVEA